MRWPLVTDCPPPETTGAGLSSMWAKYQSRPKPSLTVTVLPTLSQPVLPARTFFVMTVPVTGERTEVPVAAKMSAALWSWWQLTLLPQHQCGGDHSDCESPEHLASCRAVRWCPVRATEPTWPHQRLTPRPPGPSHTLDEMLGRPSIDPCQRRG